MITPTSYELENSNELLVGKLHGVGKLQQVMSWKTPINYELENSTELKTPLSYELKTGKVWPFYIVVFFHCGFFMIDLAT